MAHNDILQEFLDEYQPEEGRDWSAEDRSMIKEAMTEFLIMEQWVTDQFDGSAAEKAIQQIREQCTGDGVHAQVTLLEGMMLNLIARLTRREHAISILRERLAALP